MPQIFRIGSYRVYFGANENQPLEPIHVHVSPNRPTENSTKIWITSTGRSLIANNNSHISESILRNIARIIEARNEEIIQKWEEYFGEIRYYI